MKVLAVVGPSDSGKTTVVAALAGRLRDRGRVATVKHLTHEPDVDTEGKDTARHRAGGATQTVGLTDDGTWFATGEGWNLDDVLDGFAPDYDYALVEGFSDIPLPKVVLGGRDAAGPVVATAPDADALDLDAVVRSIQNLSPHETIDSLVARARNAAGSEFDGAVATFAGPVAGRSGEAGHSGNAGLGAENREEGPLTTIHEDLCDRDGVEAVALHHRPCVDDGGVALVVVLASDRDVAFAALSDAVDRIEEISPANAPVTIGGDHRGEPD